MRYPSSLLLVLAGIISAAAPLHGASFASTVSDSVPLERLTWRHRNPRPIGQGFAGIVAGPDCFIAYGGGGLIVRSVNGVFWDVVPLPIKSSITDGLFVEGEFLLAGGSYILTSPDGLQWTTRRLPQQSDGFWPTIFQINRLGDRWAALTSKGVSMSNDGEHWEFWLFTGLGGLHRMALGPDRVVVTRNYFDNVTLLSATGAAGWTETSPTFLGPDSDVYYVDGRYVATGPGTVATSTNGMDWVLSPLPQHASFSTLDRTGPWWTLNEFASSRFWLSTDAVNWTEHTCDAIASVGSIRYRAPGTWLCYGDYAGIATSTDSAHWIRRDEGMAPTMHAIGRIGDRWVAAGQQGTVISSTDGVHWEPQVLASDGDIFFNLIADEDVLHIRSNYTAFSTTDGVHWTPGSSLPASQWDFSSLPEYYLPNGTPSWVGDRWLVPANIPRVGAGALFSSVDGRSWTQLFQSGLLITSVAGRPGAYVATGGQGTGIMYSSDLVSWTHVPIANTFNVWPSIVLEGHGWFLAGTTTGILASQDGRDWQWLPGITSQIYGGARLGDSFWFTGEYGTIIEVMPYLEAPIANLSTRAYQRPSSLPTIAGFVIEGSGPVDVLVRAVGAGLRDYSVVDVIEHPVIRLYEGDHEKMAAADWAASPARPEIEAATQLTGAFALTENGGDAALVARLSPGVYTAIVEVASSAQGNVLVEVYDSGAINGTAVGGRLVNSSTRGNATAQHPLIGGLIVKGDHPRRVLVRGIGPGLLDYDVTSAAVDPRLEVYLGQTIVAENDDWDAGTDPLLVTDAGATCHAFALKPGALDAAVVLTLEPGRYTVHVQPAKSTTGGEVLLETYYLD